MIHYISNNSFTLLVSKDSEKYCTVMSLSSGRIYRSTTSQIFNSKKGVVNKLSNKQSVDVERSLYHIIKEKKHIAKNVSNKTYNEMFNRLKMIDSYA